MNKRYLKVNDVVTITGLCKGTIYQYTSKGLIPFRKFGRLIRFEESTIIEWIENQLSKEK